MALFEAHGLKKAFGEGDHQRDVLRGVDLSVEPGELVAILGDSGSGKSTLLSVLAGLLSPDSGEILLDGTPVRGPGRERGVVFQQPSLLPWFTAAQNVGLAVDEAFAHEGRSDREARVERVLALVQLSDAREKLPAQLSGGMKQRVAVARALATAPRILLLDEPFSALDALTRAVLQEELQRILSAERATAVMITNDVDEALLLADRVAILSEGRLVPAFEVSLPRPRRRAELAHDPRYAELRHELTKRLHHSGPAVLHMRAAASGSAAAKPTREPFLELKGVGKEFATPRGTQVVVKGVDLALSEGEIVSLVGHSGCGKTTLLAMVAGLAAPTDGAIRIAGKPVVGPGPERAVVFQQHSLLPWLSAEENVQLAVEQAFPHATRAEASQRIENTLERVGLLGSRHMRPSELSAGMRQRVGVARAFAVSPLLLLLDEPFASLDSATRAELQEVLLDLWSTSHAAVLLVTHDVDEAILLSDRIAVMTDGPAATMRAVLEVNLPRPRRREASDDAARFRQMRETVLACLTGDPRAGTVAPFRLPEVPSERYLSRTARPT